MGLKAAKTLLFRPFLCYHSAPDPAANLSPKQARHQHEIIRLNSSKI